MSRVLPDGRHVLLGGYRIEGELRSVGFLARCDIVDGRVIALRETNDNSFTNKHTERVDVRPDGAELIVKGERCWAAFDAVSLELKYVFDLSAGLNVDNVYCYGDDGSVIVSLKDGGLVLVDLKGGQTANVVARFAGHTAPVRCVASSAEHHLIASGSDDKQVIVWNASTGERLATLVANGPVSQVTTDAPPADQQQQ